MFKDWQKIVQPLIYAFAGVFVAMLIVVLFPVCCRVSRMETEGFQNNTHNVIQCPKGSTTFTNIQGNTQCCKGSVEGTMCNGEILCTMSGSLSKDIPTCTKLRETYLAKLQAQCPSSVNWKSYYNDENGEKGCASQTQPDRTGPLNPASKFCKIYGNRNDLYESNSCKNVANTLNFNITFRNNARPNFCMDVNGYSEDTSTVGMAICNGADSQAFMIDAKNNIIINKQNRGALYFSDDSLQLLPRDEITEANPKTAFLKTNHSGGGFTLGNNSSGTTFCYGLDPNGNYTEPSKDKTIRVQKYPCDTVMNPNIVWNGTPTPSAAALTGKNPMEHKYAGYEWWRRRS